MRVEIVIPPGTCCGVSIGHPAIGGSGDLVCMAIRTIILFCAASEPSDLVASSFKFHVEAEEQMC